MRKISRIIGANAIFRHLGRNFSCFYRDLLYTCKISIALAIHSFDPPLGLLEAGAQRISIARVIHFVDRTLQVYFSNWI